MLCTYIKLDWILWDHWYFFHYWVWLQSTIHFSCHPGSCCVIPVGVFLKLLSVFAQLWVGWRNISFGTDILVTPLLFIDVKKEITFCDFEWLSLTSFPESLFAAAAGAEVSVQTLLLSLAFALLAAVRLHWPKTLTEERTPATQIQKGQKYCVNVLAVCWVCKYQSDGAITSVCKFCILFYFSQQNVNCFLFFFCHSVVFCLLPFCWKRPEQEVGSECAINS